MAAENKVSETRVIAAGETMDTDAPGEPIRSPSTAAERMREYRRRRHYGVLSIRVCLPTAWVDVLVKRRYLKSEHRDDREEIAIAVGDFIADNLLNT
jgi:hypothetical protein